ncbi:MAG: hypothetical protein FWE14_09785 [Lachnospiraceae bacterium]|nr:hypothetical protein [Lachnospiraceae bacterium]
MKTINSKAKNILWILFVTFIILIAGLNIYQLWNINFEKVGQHDENCDCEEHENYLVLRNIEIFTNDLYRTHLKITIEDMFMNEENIETANAIIYFDKELIQYSIELILKANNQISDERIIFLKDNLNKTFANVVLYINGKIK